MIKLFSGTAHEKLSTHVAKKLSLSLSLREVIRFGNSEVKVKILEKVQRTTCVVIQPTSNPTDTHLMELFFFADALKREGANKVIGVIPYFGYAKQNIQHTKGECVSANVIVRFLEAIGFDRIYTFDLHDEATAGVFFIPFTNLSALSLLAAALQQYCLVRHIATEDIALVSPDQGAVEKVRNFGRVFYGHEDFHQVLIEKKRDQHIPHRASPVGFYGDVKDKIAVIVDDMVVSGSTLLPAVDLCIENGARDVYAAVVHHDFTSDAPDKIQVSKLSRFFTTDTIKLLPSQHFDKLEEVSVAALIAQELKNF